MKINEVPNRILFSPNGIFILLFYKNENKLEIKSFEDPEFFGEIQ